MSSFDDTRLRGWAPTWRAFDRFPGVPATPSVVRGLSWANTVRWASDVRKSVDAEVTAIRPLLEVWDASLARLGGDPARQDWKQFRPLRLAREEDWSDWLAFLLRLPEGHSIVSALFSALGHSGVVEDIRREELVLSGRRRADLVLLWSENRASHVEVKVWDQNFDKTVETGIGCRERFSERLGWKDYVLLPEESVDAWSLSQKCEDVTLVTWSAVIRELRRALLEAEGSYQWLAFARAFCGAVEQKILGVPWISFDQNRRVNSTVVFRFGRILREALDGSNR